MPKLRSTCNPTRGQKYNEEYVIKNLESSKSRNYSSSELIGSRKFPVNNGKVNVCKSNEILGSYDSSFVFEAQTRRRSLNRDNKMSLAARVIIPTFQKLEKSIDMPVPIEKASFGCMHNVDLLSGKEIPLLTEAEIKKEIIETDSESSSSSDSSTSEDSEEDSSSDSDSSDSGSSSNSDSDESCSTTEEKPCVLNQFPLPISFTECVASQVPLIEEEATGLPYAGKKRGPKRKKPIKIRDPNKPMRKRPGEPWVPIECPHCDKTFRYISQLRQHSTAHARDRPFVCDECGKSFTRNNYLEQHRAGHIRIQENEDENSNKNNSTLTRLFPCAFCQKPFPNAYELKLHVRTHTQEKPFTCHLCERSFSIARTLKIHLRRHVGDRPFKCTENDCDKAFTVKLELQRHMRTHTGEKRVACEECGRKFSHIGILKSHILIHTGEMPYQCPFCDVYFRQGNNLDYHVRVHKWKPESLNKKWRNFS